MTNADTKDAVLCALLSELEAVDARMDEDHADWDNAILGEHWRLREAIQATPAHTAAGWRVKTRAAEIALARNSDFREEIGVTGGFVALVLQVLNRPSLASV